MGKIILKDAVVRRKGYIYYVDKDGSVCEAVSAVGNGNTKKKTVSKKVVKKTAPKKTVKKSKK